MTAELPGLKKEDVKVELTDDSLVIQGERKHEHKEDHEGFHKMGTELWPVLSVDSVARRGQDDQAKAELTDGVLKVSGAGAGAGGEDEDPSDTGGARERDKTRGGVGSRAV